MSKKRHEGPRPTPDSLGLPLGGADSHAHLDSDSLIKQLPDVMQRARAAGLSTIGQVFLGPDEYEQGKALFEGYSEVFYLLGIHPNEAAALSGASLERMRKAFQTDNRLRAVGEIGLDFYWKDCPRPVQEEAFRLQLGLARELDKPVVIHSRDAAADTLRVLESEGYVGKALLWHCFSGDALSHLDRIVGNGWHISVPGPITYPGSREYYELFARIPKDRIMIETDCPYLAPEPWRGKTNEPALVAFTAVCLAALFDMEPSAFWQLCGENTRRFFGVL